MVGYKVAKKHAFRVIANEPDGSLAQKGAIDALITCALNDKSGRLTNSGDDRPLWSWGFDVVNFNREPEGYLYLMEKAAFNLGSAAHFLLPEETGEGRDLLWRVLDTRVGFERNKISALQRLLMYPPNGAACSDFKEFFQVLAGRPTGLYSSAFKAAIPVLLIKGMHADIPKHADWIDVLDVEAGLQLLNAQPADRVSDEEIFNILVESTPESWVQEDASTHWASRSRVGDMLTILFTNRPGLAEMAMGDPDLCKWAMKTPHWDNRFLESLPGIKLEGGSYKYDSETETSGTPFVFLSLTWKPTTSKEVAGIVQAVAAEAINAGSPYASDWKVTESAAQRKYNMGVVHIGSWDSFSQDALQDGVTGRIWARIRSAFAKDYRAPIGPLHLEKDFSLRAADTSGIESYDYLSFQWSDKLPEVIAMSRNSHMEGDFFEAWSDVHVYQIMGNCPCGSWTREKIIQAGRGVARGNKPWVVHSTEFPDQVLKSLRKSNMAEAHVPSSMREDRNITEIPEPQNFDNAAEVWRRSQRAVNFLKRKLGSDELLQEAVSTTLVMLLDPIWKESEPEAVAETALATVY